MHRMSSKTRSLKVKRETVRVLASELQFVHGGGPFIQTESVGLICSQACPRPEIGTTNDISRTPGACPNLPPTRPSIIVNPIDPRP